VEVVDVMALCLAMDLKERGTIDDLDDIQVKS
jgi:hypothetical protein